MKKSLIPQHPSRRIPVPTRHPEFQYEDLPPLNQNRPFIQDLEEIHVGQYRSPLARPVLEVADPPLLKDAARVQQIPNEQLVPPVQQVPPPVQQDQVQPAQPVQPTPQQIQQVQPVQPVQVVVQPNAQPHQPANPAAQQVQQPVVNPVEAANPLAALIQQQPNVPAQPIRRLEDDDSDNEEEGHVAADLPISEPFDEFFEQLPYPETFYSEDGLLNCPKLEKLAGVNISEGVKKEDKTLRLLQLRAADALRPLFGFVQRFLEAGIPLESLREIQATIRLIGHLSATIHQIRLSKVAANINPSLTDMFPVNKKEGVSLINESVVDILKERLKVTQQMESLAKIHRSNKKQSNTA
ncbi:hypothetical protein SAMD00019534_126370 [Acytostelium subglobosum LB1]|uniref:hypothetical protein n=1 Tax=Acytostelium subglobosum LB1 TaxID=1410327 RepID=UPI000644E77B|nr:hypothetical protein SAMD00019534_126370 [Acytostelium subglobosum LB1]GAM29461.1 hypothetical protein SAMD00019534_126370 [Acytostelium subglobosum LB1]|eukprot:XP_012747588.1 hypothetical protein SAMD00019534_126370 [Acytostelium subglobosum LB1]